VRCDGIGAVAYGWSQLAEWVVENEAGERHAGRPVAEASERAASNSGSLAKFIRRIARTLEDRKWLKKNLRVCMNCLMLSKQL
jgi:hypothetical protein